MEQRVYITRAVPELVSSMLQQVLSGLRIEANSHDRNLTAAEIAQHAAGASALICTLADPVDRSLLQALAPALKVVATYAVGVNNIDLDAARELGICVTNTPGVLTDATAEIAVGLIVACARRMVEGDRLTRNDGFAGWAPLFHRGHGVFGKTLGIVGAGRIGKRVAQAMFHGFGCRVLYTSRAPHADWESELAATRLALEDLLAQSDFVSLHCPLTPQTRHLLDARRIALMKPSAILVNTARGPVIDEAALVKALNQGVIAAAGLDVYEDEPRLAPGLTALPNVVLLPHIGSATLETRNEMGRMCAQAVIDVLQGRKPRHALA